MLATPLQVSRKTFWRLQHRCKSREKLSGVCNTVASPAKNFLAFATPLQVPRKTFWRLQHCCKSHEKLFGVCGSPASASENFLAFAGVPQVPRKTFWRLREPRKCLGKLFVVYGSPASASENFLAFAGAPQVPREMLWCLRECCKHFQKRFGHGVASVETADSILTPNSRFVDKQKAREGAVLMRSPCQRPLARRSEIKTASIFAAAKRKNDGSVAQLDRATAF